MRAAATWLNPSPEPSSVAPSRESFSHKWEKDSPAPLLMQRLAVQGDV
jgi:hypothetical protein